MAPGLHESGGMEISPEISAPHTRSGEEGVGESEGGPKTPRSDSRVGGGNPPRVRYSSGEGCMGPYTRVVP